MLGSTPSSLELRGRVSRIVILIVIVLLLLIIMIAIMIIVIVVIIMIVIVIVVAGVAPESSEWLSRGGRCQVRQ